MEAATGHALKKQELREFFVKVRRGNGGSDPACPGGGSPSAAEPFLLRPSRRAGLPGVPCRAVKATTTRSRRARRPPSCATRGGCSCRGWAASSGAGAQRREQQVPNLIPNLRPGESEPDSIAQLRGEDGAGRRTPARSPESNHAELMGGLALRCELPGRFAHVARVEHGKAAGRWRDRPRAAPRQSLLEGQRAPEPARPARPRLERSRRVAHRSGAA